MKASFRGVVRFVDVIVSLAIMALGAALIYGSQWDESVGEILSKWLNKPIITAVLGAIIALGALRVLTSRGKRSDKGETIQFKCDDGNVSISLKAIHDYIQRLGQEFPAIKSLDSRVIQRKGMLEVQLIGKVLAGYKIRELSSLLQMRVSQSICDDLGLEDKLRSVDFDVREIVGEPGKLHVADKPQMPAATPKIEVKPELPPTPAPKPKPEPVKDVEVEPEAEMPQAELPLDEPERKDAPEPEPEVEEEKPKPRRKKKRSYTKSSSQYVTKPKKTATKDPVESDEFDDSEEVELDAEDNPFLSA